MTYCTYCGTEEIDEWTGRYDKNTGAKVTRKVCPKEPCLHGEHDGEIIPWEKPLFDLSPPSYRKRCRRCGKEWNEY